MITSIGNLVGDGTTALHTIVQRVRNFSQPPHADTVIQEQGSRHVPRRWQWLMRFLPCVSAPHYDASRRNSVASVISVAAPYFIEGNVCPMTHPATSAQAKGFYEVFGQPELFRILTSHLDALAATNLLLTRKHSPDWVEATVKALPNRAEQARFLGKTGSFAKTVRELMTDTHLLGEKRIVSTTDGTEDGLLTASESAVNAAWLSARVPQTKDGSPPRHKFMSHALSWLAKFGPCDTVFNLEEITSNSELAAKVRQTLENLAAAAILPDDGPHDPLLSQAKDWVVNYAHAYLEYSPLHDSSDLIDFFVEKITTERQISIRLAEQYAMKFGDGSASQLDDDTQMRFLRLMQVMAKSHYIDTPAIGTVLSDVTKALVYDRHNNLEPTLAPICG